MFYLHDVVEGSNLSSANAQNAPSDDEGVLDEDCEDFASVASSELEDEGLQEPSSPRPHTDASQDVELAPPAFGLPSVVEATDSDPITANAADAERMIPRGKSEAHFDLKDNKIVFLSLDLETGGEYCGIIQLSGQLFRQNPADRRQKTFIVVEETFNEYVRPPDGAFWNEEACRMSHGLTAQSPQIQNGLPFVSVWTNFCSWIDRHVGTHEKCILCAYRGETCDMRWIWKHCLAPRSQLNIPPQIVYFMDPLEVIKGYKCPLTVDTSKYIAARTTNYAYNDWVVPTARLDRDGNTTRRPIMSAIFPKRGESLPANARHRCLVTKDKKKYQVTEHFVFAWLGAVMTVGALFNGDNNRGIDAVYSNASYGVSVPFIQNTMRLTALTRE